jgi:hypothetical protein
VRGHQPDLFALAAGVNRLREGGDFALGRLEVAEPKLRVARETDPDRFVRCPFGRWRGVDFRHHQAANRRTNYRQVTVVRAAKQQLHK